MVAPLAMPRCIRWARCCATARGAEGGLSSRHRRRATLRLQAFGVTEPTSGTDTTRIRTIARREGDKYIVNGQKVWISRAEHRT